jgi:hypothetical protein
MGVINVRPRCQGPWGCGDLDEHWETESGQHMMWNGAFGALLFINDLEYMGANRSAFFKQTSLPLLEGLLDWWACYLVKTPCLGSPACGPGGYRYDDANDAVNEGSKTVNSQLGLAFVARLADVLGRLTIDAGIYSRSTETAKDIALHLAPFDTTTCISPNHTGRNETVWVNSKGASIAHSSMFALYPYFPSEFLSQATASAKQQVTAQVSARVYNDLGAGRPVEVFPSTVAAGTGLSEFAYSPQDVIEGLKAQMHRCFGPNLLCDTNGGGIENVGMSRAVSEMLVMSPSGKYIQLFPFWPAGEDASFGGLMVKGGFRVWANLTAADGVKSPVRLRSIAGAAATVANPWPGYNVSVQVEHEGKSVPLEVNWLPLTYCGKEAFRFQTVAGDDRTFSITKVAARKAMSATGNGRSASTLPLAPVACTSFSGNCTACLAASDMRSRWASPCVYLSGPTEGGARCQPAKWWFPPYDSAKIYPHAHACAKCTEPPNNCPVLPPPPPPAPAPEGICPLRQSCKLETKKLCGSVQKDEAACIACMKAHSNVLTKDGCKTVDAVAFCGLGKY